MYLPRPSTARLKIPPHITEVHKPQSTRNMIFAGTLTIPNEMSDWNTGIITLVSTEVKIAARTNTRATPLTVVSIALLETLPAIEPPTRRPTSIRNQ